MSNQKFEMPSAYIVFSTEKRESVKKAHPDWAFGQIGKELGKLWQGLSESEKAKYQAKATPSAKKRESKKSKDDGKKSKGKK